MFALTDREMVDDLLFKAIPNGECLECHLVPVQDRPGRQRHYVQVGGRGGKKWIVSRLVWHVLVGPIPQGMCILHDCDNPLCINSTHMFLGTNQDNTDDMIAKGRKVDDPEVGMRRREATANLIRPLFEQGLNRYAIADRLGISPSTVWNYTNGPYRSSLSIPSGHEHNVCVGLDLPWIIQNMS